MGLGNSRHNIRADVNRVEITISLVDFLGDTEFFVLSARSIGIYLDIVLEELTRSYNKEESQ